MKINKSLFGKSALAAASTVLLLLGTTSCVDLWSEVHPGTYYTNNGETVADYLEGNVENHGDFSYFIAIIKRANLWGQMRTYGNYTCLAPSNAVLQTYFDERRHEADSLGLSHLSSVFTDINSVLQDSLVCDTIARTHLFNDPMFASDISGDDVFKFPNMMDRYISYHSYAEEIPYTDIDGNKIVITETLKGVDGSDSAVVTRDSMVVRLKYLINEQATLIKLDDTVQNGVVHQVDKVLRSSNKMLPGTLEENTDISIFFQALMTTHLNNELEKYVLASENYPTIDYEWTQQALRDHFSGIHTNKTSVEVDPIVYPEQRKHMYTMFVLTDSVLAKYSDEYTAKAGLSNGIRSYDDLVKYADAVYEEGKGKSATDKSSSIYKLIAYHILPYRLTYDQFNTSQEALVNNHKFLDEHDIEDFFETLLPNSIMRISTAYIDGKRHGIFINRKGTQKLNNLIEGVRILGGNDYNYKYGIRRDAENGTYFYVDKFALYDEKTRTENLNCRLRVMCCTLSPDFINSGARGRLNQDPAIIDDNIKKMVFQFKMGYCDNFMWIPDQTRFYVRYRDSYFGTYNGDEITVRGSYDLAFKLPAVPTAGNYEIRFWNNSLAGSGSTIQTDRGIVQFYFHQYNPVTDNFDQWRDWDWKPEDIPVDLRLGGSNGRIGMIDDDDVESKYSNSSLSETEKANAIKEEIRLNDRALRIRGFMKAPDSYGSLRDDNGCYRKIVANEYLKPDMTYYIRMRQVFEEDGVFPFSFIEIVPKSVYEGSEDMH